MAKYKQDPDSDYCVNYIRDAMSVWKYGDRYEWEDLEKSAHYLAREIDSLLLEIRELERDKEELIDKKASLEEEIARKAVAKMRADCGDLVQELDGLKGLLQEERKVLEKVKEEYAYAQKDRQGFEASTLALRASIKDDEKALKQRKAELERKRKEFIEWEIEQEKALLRRELEIKAKIEKRTGGVQVSGSRKIEL